MPNLLDIGLAVMIAGFMYALPTINTVFINFSEFGSTSIMLLRAGLLILVVYFLTGGSSGGDRYGV